MSNNTRVFPLIERLRTRQGRRKIFVWSILIPILTWFMIYMFVPIVSVFLYSFTNAKMQYTDFKWVGLTNYTRMLVDDPLVPIAVMNTIKAVLIILPGTVLLALLLATALNAVTNKARETFTFIYFMPSVVPMTAIALVWSWLYHPQYGLLNALFGMIGIPAQKFIQDSGQALLCICIVQIWYNFGYYAVVLLAAIRNVSADVLEAADMDGAGPLTKFFRIVIPLIKPNLIFVSIMSTINAFMLFTPVDVLTLGRGTPGTSTMVLMLKIKIDGIQQGDIGYGSSMSMLLLAIIMAVSLVQWILSQEGKQGTRKA
ncbi:MAG: sugar ABC transporter permease [Ruthenibacterium sp.]